MHFRTNPNVFCPSEFYSFAREALSLARARVFQLYFSLGAVCVCVICSRCQLFALGRAQSSPFHFANNPSCTVRQTSYYTYTVCIRIYIFFIYSREKGREGKKLHRQMCKNKISALDVPLSLCFTVRAPDTRE